jgi:hypothetical protein
LARVEFVCITRGGKGIKVRNGLRFFFGYEKKKIRGGVKNVLRMRLVTNRLVLGRIGLGYCWK